jgi:hypothetical protein
VLRLTFITAASIFVLIITGCAPPVASTSPAYDARISIEFSDVPELFARLDEADAVSQQWDRFHIGDQLIDAAATIRFESGVFLIITASNLEGGLHVHSVRPIWRAEPTEAEILEAFRAVDRIVATIPAAEMTEPRQAEARRRRPAASSMTAPI